MSLNIKDLGDILLRNKMELNQLLRFASVVASVAFGMLFAIITLGRVSDAAASILWPHRGILVPKSVPHFGGSDGPGRASQEIVNILRNPHHHGSSFLLSAFRQDYGDYHPTLLPS